MTFGMDNGRFWTEFTSCGEVKDIKTECELYAKQLSQEYDNLVLSLSTGLDSQIVLHSFMKQGLKLDCAFMSLPGYNDNEYEQLKVLADKYNFEPIIVELDPIALKDEIIAESEELDLRPYQILHKRFLEKLPSHVNFIQGLEGPDLIFKNGHSYVAEGWYNFEKSRLRAFQTINRTGTVISWERRSQIYLAMMTDPIMKSFLCSKEYFLNQSVVTKAGNRSVEWDAYIKPIMYARHWKDELIYFPKYGGHEAIDYIANGPKNKFRENCAYISVPKLVAHLKSNDGVMRYWQKD